MNGFADWFIEYIVKSVLRVFYRVFYRAEWINYEVLPKGGGIVCAGHISNHDGPLIGCVIRKRLVHWATKEELFHNKFFAKVLAKLGCIKVNRSKADIGSVRDLFRVLHKGGLVGIFPEGTRMRNKERSSVNLSRSPIILSERTGLPVIPVSITGKYKMFRKSTVIVGKPVVFRKDNGGKYTEEEQGMLMDKLMNDILSTARNY